MRNSLLILAISATLFSCSEGGVGKADSFFKSGSYDEALKAYTLYIKDHPNEHDVFYKRGAAYEKLAQLDNALSDYTKAANLESKESKYWLGMGRINYLMSMEIKDADNNTQLQKRLPTLNAGLTAIEEALKINANIAEAHLVKGQILMRSQKTKSARDEFNKVIQLEPDNAEAYLNRGYVFASTSKFTEACADAKKVKELGHPQGAQVVGAWCQ